MDTGAPDTRALLRQATGSVHEALDSAVMRQRPFDGLERYAALLRAHHGFFAACAPAYLDPDLSARIPGLAGRDRLALTALDLQDLDLPPAPPGAAPRMSGTAALGWLYVAEGSKMGGAVLAKRAALLGLSAQHGARHLAPAAEGPALHWRRFIEGLNAVPLDDAGRRSAIDGANAAFRLARELILRAFAALD